MTLQSDFSERSDQDLVESARAGIAAAQRELFRRFHPRLLEFLTHMVGDPDAAEDLAQETFVNVFNALEDNPPESNVWAWMRKIANNLGIEHFRARHTKNRHLETVPLDDGPDVTPVGKRAQNAHRLAERSDPTPVRSTPRDLRERLERAIKQLPARYRRCMLMRYLEERSNGDVAQFLGIPEGTVRSRLHYGLKELRKTLPEDSDLLRYLSGSTPV